MAKSPSKLIADFERDCEAAGIAPAAALAAGKVHPSLWYKWRDDQASPTLRNFEAAREGLDRLKREGEAA